MAKGTYFYGVWLGGRGCKYWCLDGLREGVLARETLEEHAAVLNAEYPHCRAVVKRVYVKNPR